MAEDCVNQAVIVAGLEEKECATRTLRIHGHLRDADRFDELAMYGSDATTVRTLIESSVDFEEQLHPALPYRAGECVWSARFEMARTVDDYLSRRSRATFLNARAAIEMAPRVAQLMAAELRRDTAWEEQEVKDFNEIARNYIV
jgi:glycerol-3-phosphate dehydrogenase